MPNPPTGRPPEAHPHDGHPHDGHPHDGHPPDGHPLVGGAPGASPLDPLRVELEGEVVGYGLGFRPPAPDADLPTGTLTFLLTDIEGSTALWDRAPDRMRAALARHDTLVEAAVAAHTGTVVRAQGGGDGHLSVFRRAEDAVAAALAIQAAIDAEPWPTPTPLRVRIGLHTGRAEVRDGGYFGEAVTRCGRLQELGHGGEIVLSEVTATLVRDALPPGAALRDLGERRLRGLARAEHAHLLAADGAAGPGAPGARPRPLGLPPEATALVGREQDVAAIRALLRSGARLVTLTGPGGVGKTRLAAQVAADLAGDLADGALFVALAPVADPSLVVPAIARALGVPEAPGQPLAEAVAAHLRPKELLLVLDNFEQVAGAAPLVGDLLGEAPGLRAVVTSRALLHISGEHDFPVRPLAVPEAGPAALGPDPVAGALRYEAVRLFVERARALRPDFALTAETAPTIVEICRRLDGLPLAIELAAARIRLLPPRALLARLERRLPFLTAGPADLPARQQTLRDTIAWSYDLLADDERRLFRLLATFAGGADLDAAEAVCRPLVPDLDILDGLTSLLDKSLLRTLDRPDGEPRFAMLDTIREFGLEQLAASGLGDEATRRHADHFLRLAEDAEPRLAGPEQTTWLDRLEAEHDNLRAALDWFAERGTADPADAERALRLAAALWRFWYVRGYLTEGRRRLAGVLALPGSAAPTLTRALALNGAGNLAFTQGDYRAAQGYHEESLRLRRALDDLRGVAGSLNNLGLIARDRGDHARAAGLFEEAVAINRALGNRAWEAINHGNHGIALHEAGDLDGAAARHDESLRLFRSLNDAWGIGMTLASQAAVVADLGDSARARALYEESLVYRRRVGDRRGIAASLFGLGRLDLFDGDAEAARARFRESLELAHALGDRPAMARALEGLAALAAEGGHAERAAGLLGAAAALREGLDAAVGRGERDVMERARRSASAGGAGVEAARLAGHARPEAVVVAALAGPDDPEPRAAGHPDAGAPASAGARPATGAVPPARPAEGGGAASGPEGGAGHAARPAPDGASAVRQPAPTPRAVQPTQAAPSPLTRREREVARLVGRGLTNKQIAAELVIAERTADTHVANILGKLGFASRAQVAAWAAAHGLLTEQA